MGPVESRALSPLVATLTFMLVAAREGDFKNVRDGRSRANMQLTWTCTRSQAVRPKNKKGLAIKTMRRWRGYDGIGRLTGEDLWSEGWYGRDVVGVEMPNEPGEAE